MFPLDNIPAGIRWISGIVPARYYIEITRDAFVRGGGWASVWHAPAMLGLLGSVYFINAWRKMRKMQVEL
jgi:ABC-2 type transport system permease protein